MMKWNIFRSLLIASCLVTNVAHASIIYQVDHRGETGSVKGTITTDGTLGVLTSLSIIDLSLTLTDKAGSSLIDWNRASFWEYAISADTEVIGLIATRRHLLSDPIAAGGEMYLTGGDIWDEGPYWEASGEVYAGPTIFDCECSFDEYFELQEARVANAGGSVVIGVSTAFVSESGTLTLTSLGLALLIAVRAGRR